MLDQNTDRMWYVIGAVIVGAALIFLVNSSFPQLFASVTGVFEDKVEETSKIANSINPTDGQNLIVGGELEIEGGYTWVDGTAAPGHNGIVNVGDRVEFLRHTDLAPIFERYGLDQTYTLSFDIKTIKPNAEKTMDVYMQSGSGTKYNFLSQRVAVSTEYQRHSISGLKASLNGKNQTSPEPYKTAHLAFYGGYGSGNVPVVKNIRLVRELK